MNKNRQNELLGLYIDLAYKLGKVPSGSDANRAGITKKQIDYNFKNFSGFKERAFQKYPELHKFVIPARLGVSDIDHYRIGAEKKILKKTNETLVSDVSTLEYIAAFAEKVFSGRVKAGKSIKVSKPIDRIQTLVLSDLHFGADLKSDETGAQDYGVVEEARRFASIIKEASEYKLQHRSHTKLKVLLLGDIIENQLHDPRTGATIAEQSCRAIHLLIQGIAYLADKYPTVEVECSTGNHGRNTSRHNNRAIHQKWDSLETLIYYAVKQACQKLKNVTFNIPKTPMGSYDAFGKKIGYLHGDTVLNVGNPGSALNVRQIENQINRMNASLHDKDEYSVVVHGHTHTGYVLYLPNGTVVLGNGSLPPPDPFAISLGILETKGTGQWMFESVAGYPVGDLRYLKTGKDYDKDESLDVVIKKFTNF